MTAVAATPVGLILQKVPLATLSKDMYSYIIIGPADGGKTQTQTQLFPSRWKLSFFITQAQVVAQLQEWGLMENQKIV